MSRRITFAAMAGGVDLRRLRYFVAVAEERHFGRAAARLHLTTPPLSQRIRELEQELGVVLFERTSRTVVLTTAGERLLDDARDVLRCVDRFTARAAELAAVPSPCNVAYCHGSEDGMMRTIAAFRAARPASAVRADGLTSLRILDGVRDGRISVGIVRGPVVDRDRITSRPLARIAVDHVVVPPAHPLAAADAVDGSDLDGEPVLIVDRAEAPTAHDDIVAYCRTMGATPRWITHAAVQVERVLDLVAVGTGIGWLNSWQAERARRRSDVAVRPLHPVALHDDLLVVWRGADESATTAAFVAAAVLSFGTGPIGPISKDGCPVPAGDQLAAAMEGSIDGRTPS